MKLEKELTYNQPEVEFTNFKGRFKKADKNVELLNELNKKSQERHNVLGGVFWRTVADGRVPYQVVEINNKTAVVKRCAGICLDLYEDSLLGSECELPVERVKMLVNQQRRLYELFGAKK